MALNEAFYLSSTGKIYGVLSNYVIRFNASTGAKEASAKVCAPMQGPMRIIGLGGSVYVASMFDLRVTGAGVASNRTIWTVDPTTLVAADTLGVNSKIRAAIGSVDVWEGPTSMVFNGTKLTFQYSTKTGEASYMYVDVVTPATNNVAGANGTSNKWTPETWDYDGTTLNACDPAQQQVEIFNPTLVPGSNLGHSDTVPDSAVSVAYAANVGFAYSVCGNESLYRNVLYVAPFTATLHNLGPIAPNCAPTRIRYIDGLLYLPCQKTDVVIVWNPVSDTGVVKTGFDSPIDVIWTGSKLWAVQTSIQSLKEIT